MKTITSLSTMTQPRSEMIYEIPLITDKILTPLIQTTLEGLSLEQWRMIAYGELDSLTRAALAGTCMQMVRSVSTVILNAVIPVAEQNTSSRRSKDDFKVSEEQIHASLGDSLTESFNKVFKVQSESCVLSENLTQLVAQEVTLKVNFVLAVVVRTPVSPSVGMAFFVNSTVSSTSALDEMVVCAAEILSQRFAELDSKTKQTLSWRGFSETTSEKGLDEDEAAAIHLRELMENLDSFITAATKEVSSILLKKLFESTGDKITPETALQALDVSASIVKTITESLQSLNFGDAISQMSPVLNFPILTCDNLHSLVSTLKAFLASQVPMSENHEARINLRWHEFHRFSEKLICDLMEDLQSTMNVLARDCSEVMKSKSPEIKTPSLSQCELPGYIQDPEELQASPETVFTVSRTTFSDSDDEEACEEDMMTVIDRVQRMLLEVFLPNQQAGDESNYEHQGNIMCHKKTCSLTKKLTEEVYHYLMQGQTYQIPTVPEGEMMSDAAIPWVADSLQPARSPELSYTITENRVRCFLLNMLLWFRSDPDSMNLTNVVLEYLTDIEGVISGILTGQRDDESTTYSEELREDSFQDSFQYSVQDLCTGDLTMMFDGMVSDLLTRLLTHTAASINKPSKETDCEETVNYLTDLCLTEMETRSNWAIPEDFDTDELVFSLFNELTEKFGSASLLHSALTLRDPAFDQIIIDVLMAPFCRIQTSELESENTKSFYETAPSKTKSHKKCRLRRFFSAVAKAISWPFTSCKP
ncbi:uncharacterized protein LOC117830764 [Notolabrus celidotus]|uniref:uncharacterized protein LOC117830764 n=1 Tax=Notolabrus celidotus TaxID=1203425 RepID=UPI00149038D2|nr:uncharacterized protein LOC117830764 [Notolabrus celidotus]